MSTILLTGATGFLGREVARSLLSRQPSRRLVALIRAPTDAAAGERLASITKDLPGSLADRIQPLRGDVSEPRLGLSESSHASLCAQVDRIVHVAASTRFDHPLAEARRQNVDSTRHVLTLCKAMRAAGREARLDHVSTAYVAGTRVDLVHEDDRTEPAGFRNSYEQSKREAEGLCHEAQADLRIVIHRPSIIVGSAATGKTTRYHGMYEVFSHAVGVYGGWRKALTRLVPLPFSPECPIDLVPVDFVADAIATLVDRPDAVGRCFHLTAGAEGAAVVRTLVDLVCAHFAVRSPRYLQSGGLAGVLVRASSPLVARLAPRLHRHAALILPYTRQNPSFDTANARLFGLTPPAVTDYLLRTLDYAYANDFGRAGAAAAAGAARSPSPRSRAALQPTRVVR